MNARTSALLTVVGWTLVVAGCGGGAPPDVASLAYVNQEHRFAMNVPEDWTQQEDTGTPAFFAIGPEVEGKVRSNVIVVVRPAAQTTTLQDVVGRSKAKLATFTGFELISEEPRNLADGTKAHVVTFRQGAFRTPLVQRQMYVLAQGRAYTVTATTGAETFADEETHFEVCFRSFRAGW